MIETPASIVRLTFALMKMPGSACASSGAEASMTESPIAITRVPVTRTVFGGLMVGGLTRRWTVSRNGLRPGTIHHGSGCPAGWPAGAGLVKGADPRPSRDLLLQGWRGARLQDAVSGRACDGEHCHGCQQGLCGRQRLIVRGKARRIKIDESHPPDSEGNLFLTHRDINLASRESYQQRFCILDVLRGPHDSRVGALHDRIAA